MISIDSIITAGPTQAYRISNADGKTWLLPASDLAIGLELYQPSGIKGKLLKTLLPKLHLIPGITALIHATSERISLRQDVIETAEKAFGVTGLKYSIFGGTPSVHQKITIQFSHGRKILGYCKLSDSESIRQLFIHEGSLLNHLAAKGLEGIPKCLTCGTLPDGTSIFIQSTVKTLRSHSPHHWTSLHESFLRRLSELTSAKTHFRSTDLYASICALKDNIDRLPEQFHTPILSRIDDIFSAKSDTEVEYSAFHADFTPWNMIIEGDSLFVFDWEYSRLSYPPMLDRYHFFIQQALHVTHLSPQQIYENMCAMPWYDPEDYTIYLLDIISRFTLRENRTLSPSLINMLGIWTNLLERTANNG